MGKRTSKKLEKRNKPLKRIRWMFIVMFSVLSVYIGYYALIIAPEEMMNDYNPRLGEIEARVQRGPILDRNGNVLAASYAANSTGSLTAERRYPYGNAFSHVIGYTGHGKSGIEGYSNLDLLDTNSTLWERIRWSVQGTRPVGNSVQTTLDTELQRLARESLGDNRGAVIALEPATGKVLAMVSAPDYDPNNIADSYQGIVTNDEQAALLNRATQGLYPPGSTFKVITTIAHLESNSEKDFMHYCLGEDIIGQKEIHCYNSFAHGRLSLSDAFAKSCNTAYAKIGQDLDADRLKAISEIMGYNQPISMEVETSVSQFVLDGSSSGPEVTETSIGQGKTLTTPLLNVMMASAVANNGIAMQPYIVDKVIDDDGTVLVEESPEVYMEMLSPDMAQFLEGYMVHTSEEGTAKALKNDSYQIASKTGSAENPQGDAHAWYVGYAPVGNPEIAIAIVVENVGSSSSNAVPIAKELYDHYLNVLVNP